MHSKLLMWLRVDCSEHAMSSGSVPSIVTVVNGNSAHKDCMIPIQSHKVCRKSDVGWIIDCMMSTKHFTLMMPCCAV